MRSRPQLDRQVDSGKGVRLSRRPATVRGTNAATVMTQPVTLFERIRRAAGFGQTRSHWLVGWMKRTSRMLNLKHRGNVRFIQPTTGKERRSDEPEPGYLTRLRLRFLILAERDGTHERSQADAARDESRRADNALGRCWSNNQSRSK